MKKFHYIVAKEDGNCLDKFKRAFISVTRQYKNDWQFGVANIDEPATILLLFISNDFLYAYGDELDDLMKIKKENSVCVIPIMVRPTNLENTALDRIVTLPRSGKALTEYNGLDAPLSEIVGELRKIIELY